MKRFVLSLSFVLCPVALFLLAGCPDETKPEGAADATPAALSASATAAAPATASATVTATASAAPTPPDGRAPADAGTDAKAPKKK